MVERRFGPLIVAVVIAFFGLVVRLFQVQILEYEVWAAEAVNLVRKATIEPHERGRIFDRKGRVIARDEPVYELEFIWRDFRRGHPLGQVAQMRSLLQMRPVSLEEAFESIFDWADELVDLTPADIDAFGRGEGIVLGGALIAASEDPGADRRWARAADLHYYVKALFGLSRSEGRRISRKRKDPKAWRLPYLELVAQSRDKRASEVREGLYQRLEHAVDHLGVLAGLVRSETRGEGIELDWLVERIEATRRRLEDSTADDLFAKAAGFGAWRMDDHNLSRLDLDWLRRCLYWDEARLNQWVLDRGALWSQVVDRYLAGHTLARFKIGPNDPADRVLNALMHFFQPPERRSGVFAALPRDWRTSDEVVVLATLDEHFGDALEGGARSKGFSVFPIQDQDLRRAQAPSPQALVSEVLARTFDGTLGSSPEELDQAAASLVALAGRDRMTWHANEIDEVGRLLKVWNRRLQARIGDRIAELSDAAGVVHIRPQWIKAASEERAYVFRDRSARPTRLESEPTYDLVQLVTRFPKRYAGFAVRDRTRRKLSTFDFDGLSVPVAGELIGRVRAPYLAHLLDQRDEELELLELQTKLGRTDQNIERIRELTDKLRSPDEFEGGSGIEAYFDQELRGRNGYRETQGLQDRRRGRRKPIHNPAVDGLDLRLTLDFDLQRAAQDVLLHPEPLPAGEDRGDPVWLAHPVGAIVMLNPEGDILAAASVPVRPGTPGPYQDGEAASAIDRTLRRPRGQPPGSVFKPFVAAWALQYRGLDADEHSVFCMADGQDLARYGKVHCHSELGHSWTSQLPLDLKTALRRSCNSYFAYVGEQYLDGRSLREMASTYGFGQPVGVRSLRELRRGWIENYHFDGPLAMRATELREDERQRLGNGLSHIDVTPMQIARAYAGLATGSLPDLRLVRFAGDEEYRSRSRALPIEPQHLERVHEALREVVAHPQGTAFRKGVGREDLGFELAVKTGSADYKLGTVPDYPLKLGSPGEPASPVSWVNGMRKHTWIAGWFPASEPRAILVVYVHDTSTTSSHGAVYLASQFLREQAVRDYLVEEGVVLDFRKKQ